MQQKEIKSSGGRSGLPFTLLKSFQNSLDSERCCLKQTSPQKKSECTEGCGVSMLGFGFCLEQKLPVWPAELTVVGLASISETSVDKSLLTVPNEVGRGWSRYRWWLLNRWTCWWRNSQKHRRISQLAWHLRNWTLDHWGCDKAIILDRFEKSLTPNLWHLYTSPEIYLKRKISALRWESNPQPSQLWCDALPVELPSPWEQGGGE